MKSHVFAVALVAMVAGSVEAKDLPEVISDTSQAVVLISWQSGVEIVEVPQSLGMTEGVLQLKGQKESVEALAGLPQPHAEKTEPATTFACGTLISADGLIVAPGPNTLATDVGDIEVRLPSGETHQAKRLVVDRRSELSLLKIDTQQELAFIEPVAAEVEVGESLLGVYRTVDLESIASVGIVAAKERSIQPTLRHVLQTELQLGPGSSGSPVVSLDGQLVGIAVATSGAPSSRTSFAIPAKHVATLIEVIDESRTVVLDRAYMGVALAMTPAGEVAVNNVVEGSGAEKAGIQANDIILAVDVNQVSTIEELVDTVAQLDANQEVRVTIRRGDQEYELPVTLSLRNVESQSGDFTVGRVLPSEILSVPVELSSDDGGAKNRLYSWLNQGDEDRALPTTLRVQRSGLGDRVEELARELKELRSQLHKLTASIDRLEKKLAE